MKYYLVALFDVDSYAYAEKIQKELCKKYKLYNDLPTLHITLEIIGDPDIEKLSSLISSIIKPYKKFKVSMDGAICFDPPHKSVNLKIENKGYIMRLVRKINTTLKENGFDVRENIDFWDLHISLANTNYAVREWSSSEYVAACNAVKESGFINLLKIDKIELWKPINNKKKMVVKSFPLRDY